MNLEDTKFVIEIWDFNEVNSYLKLGWVLTGQYVVNRAEEYAPANQASKYIVSWLQENAEPEHPADSSFMQHQEFLRRLK